MSFIRRLGYYLIGLSIGLVFLAFFLRRKSDQTGVQFCYLPNCRVLKDLREAPRSYSGTILQEMESGTLDSTAIAAFLTEGTVDFDTSTPRATPCKIYFIKAPLRDSTATMEVHHCPDGTQIVNLR
jgi:hypothetical protein